MLVLFLCGILFIRVICGSLREQALRSNPAGDLHPAIRDGSDDPVLGSNVLDHHVGKQK
jgi:hypothetical protein